MADYRLLTDEELLNVTGRGDGFDVQIVATRLMESGAYNIPGLSNLPSLYNEKNWTEIYKLINKPEILNNPIVAGCMCEGK